MERWTESAGANLLGDVRCTSPRSGEHPSRKGPQIQPRPHDERGRTDHLGHDRAIQRRVPQRGPPPSTAAITQGNGQVPPLLGHAVPRHSSSDSQEGHLGGIQMGVAGAAGHFAVRSRHPRSGIPRQRDDHSRIPSAHLRVDRVSRRVDGVRVGNQAIPRGTQATRRALERRSSLLEPFPDGRHGFGRTGHRHPALGERACRRRGCNPDIGSRSNQRQKGRGRRNHGNLQAHLGGRLPHCPMLEGYAELPSGTKAGKGIPLAQPPSFRVRTTTSADTHDTGTERQPTVLDGGQTVAHPPPWGHGRAAPRAAQRRGTQEPGRGAQASDAGASQGKTHTPG